MILHELSHAYHHKFLPRGFDNPEVKAAYQYAVKTKIYESVLQNRQHRREGLRDPKPPGVFRGGDRSLLRHQRLLPIRAVRAAPHDPKAYELLKKLWGEKADRTINERGSGR